MSAFSLYHRGTEEKQRNSFEKNLSSVCLCVLCGEKQR